MAMLLEREEREERAEAARSQRPVGRPSKPGEAPAAWLSTRAKEFPKAVEEQAAAKRERMQQARPRDAPLPSARPPRLTARRQRKRECAAALTRRPIPRRVSPPPPHASCLAPR
eukprot:5858508-Prymnesium_polylepis.1